MSCRLGYFLARTNVYLPWSDSRIYRGVDRGPWRPNPLEIRGTEYGALWERIWEAEETGHLQRNLRLAKELARALSKFGQQTEVIFADATMIPTQYPPEWADVLREQLDFLLRRSQGIQPPAPELEEIGFDVSTPRGWHSAIFQPSPWRGPDERFLERLNRDGLLESEGAAEDLASASNGSTYSLAGEFAVIRVLA